MPSRFLLSRPLVGMLWMLPLFATASATGFAQSATEANEPAHIAFVDGSAALERDGDGEVATPNVPVVVGDRLSTAAGRVELLFPDGSALDIDQYSSVDLLSPTLIRLAAGRAIMSVAGANLPTIAVRYRVDTPAASITVEGAGEFRIVVLADGKVDQTDLAVMRGRVTFATDRASILVRSGERSLAAADGQPSPPQAFNSARFDEFDRWALDRRAARTNPPSTRSAQYLPSELRPYSGTLDQYGSWQYNAPYGYVWYPTVAAEWQPYYYGYWSSVPSYGWTWVGADVWSWPTHHFGRWGHVRGSWFWIPGRSWSTAWVSWASAPGYMSWCPLGFDGRPVFGLAVGSWSGWVIVPRSSFSIRSVYARRHSIPERQLPRTTAFVAQASAPAPAPRAARTNIGAVPSAAVAIPRIPGSQQNTYGSASGLRTPHDDRSGLASREQPATTPRTSTQTPVQSPPPQSFRQPPTDTTRTPPVDRSAPARPVPANPPQAVPRVPEGGTPPRYRSGTPAAREPGSDASGGGRRAASPEVTAPSASTPAGAAPAPRSTPPPAETRQPAPTRQPHASADDAARAPERAAEAPRPSSGSSGAGRGPDRPAASGGGESRAVPKDQGSGQGSRDAGRRR